MDNNQTKEFEYTTPVMWSLIGAFLLFFLIDWFGWHQYQFLAVMWLVPSWGMFMLWAVDKFILASSDTYQEIIVKGNVAYAYWLLCFTLLILGGVVAAFLLYFSLILGKS